MQIAIAFFIILAILMGISYWLLHLYLVIIPLLIILLIYLFNKRKKLITSNNKKDKEIKKKIDFNNTCILVISIFTFIFLIILYSERHEECNKYGYTKILLDKICVSKEFIDYPVYEVDYVWYSSLGKHVEKKVQLPSPLERSIINGDKEITKKLLNMLEDYKKKLKGEDSQKKIVDNEKRKSYWEKQKKNKTPNELLVLAIEKNDKEVVIEAIKLGANVNSEAPYKYSNNYTVLMYASQLGYAEIVQILIDNGSDVNAKDSRGYNALRMAQSIGNGSPKTIQILKQAGAK